MTSPDLPRDSRDPLDLNRVDRDIRINELEERLKDIGVSSGEVSEDCPKEIHEQFLKNVLDYESAPISSLFAALVEQGLDLPEPSSLDDPALTAKLWEIVNALAQRDTFLERTDHLSDRELYEHLWHDTLREEYPLMPAGSGWINHLDILGGCSEEDIKISQRYYDDEETRRHWARDFPDDVIPPHEDPPFDRDRLLPKPPEPRTMEYEEADEADELDEDAAE